MPLQPINKASLAHERRPTDQIDLPNKTFLHGFVAFINRHHPRMIIGDIRIKTVDEI